MQTGRRNGKSAREGESKEGRDESSKIPHHCGLSVRDMSRFARDMSHEKRDRDRIQMRM